VSSSEVLAVPMAVQRGAGKHEDSDPDLNGAVPRHLTASV
jgi:hypothetical protein